MQPCRPGSSLQQPVAANVVHVPSTCFVAPLNQRRCSHSQPFLLRCSHHNQQLPSLPGLLPPSRACPPASRRIVSTAAAAADGAPGADSPGRIIFVKKVACELCVPAPLLAAVNHSAHTARCSPRAVIPRHALSQARTCNSLLIVSTTTAAPLLPFPPKIKQACR